MNIGQLTSLSLVLMYAHRDTTYALGRMVGGTVDKCGVANDVMIAIRKLDKELRSFITSGLDDDMCLDVEIEINANAVPAKVYFVVDMDEPYVVAVLADGLDVMPLISQCDLDEYKADFITKCAKRRAESEVDNAYEYEA